MVVCVVALVAACKGPTGPAGAPGAAGSANVVYSAWFTPNPWTETTVFGIYNFNFTVVDPAISQTVLDSGIVLTYGMLDGYTTSIWPTGQVALLPITVTYQEDAQTEIDVWTALLAPDSLTINFVNNNNLYEEISTSHQFRYVIIPGSVLDTVTVSTDDDVAIRARAMTRGQYTRAQVRAMSYPQVAQLFHIRD
jgi:hypothetical protein